MSTSPMYPIIEKVFCDFHQYTIFVMCLIKFLKVIVCRRSM